MPVFVRAVFDGTSLLVDPLEVGLDLLCLVPATNPVDVGRNVDVVRTESLERMRLIANAIPVLGTECFISEILIFNSHLIFKPTSYDVSQKSNKMS